MRPLRKRDSEDTSAVSLTDSIKPDAVDRRRAAQMNFAIVE
jgi:hypothetical protein